MHSGLMAASAIYISIQLPVVLGLRLDVQGRGVYSPRLDVEDGALNRLRR